MGTIKIFAGPEGTNWSDLPNEPQITDDVIIFKGKLVVNSGTRYTLNFEVRSGATLIIDPGVTLSVWLLDDQPGSIVTVNGTLIQRGLTGTNPGLDSTDMIDANDAIDTVDMIDAPDIIFD